MKIIISNSSFTPIYEQIKNAFINEVMSGNLEEGDSIPSIRTLAQDIRISVMTIKKAYDELEREGYIITKQGKGSFVQATNLEIQKERAKREIEDHFLKAIELADKFDISKEEIESSLKILMGRDE